MRKFSIFLFFVLLEAGTVWAQGTLPQAAGAVKKAVAPAAKKAAVLSPGARRMHALRESAMFRKISPTPQEDLRVFFPGLDAMQSKVLLARYYQVMEEFSAFKKEMDVRLFYQFMPGESSPFLPLEKEEIFRKMGNFSIRILSLKAGPFRKDQALIAALDYLNKAAGMVDPTFQNIFGHQEWPRGNRVFNEKEFYLADPSRFALFPQVRAGDGALFAFSRTKKIMESLPLKQVAVLSDDQTLLAVLERWYQDGGFGSHARWFFYSSAKNLQRDLKFGKTFDLILSDVLVPGGGGPMIAAELRQSGAKVPVIALTQYEEDIHTAQWLYSAGMDGMISANAYLGSRNGDMLFLAQKIKNYFHYRDLHHWPY